ncbi:recombinase family protein [Sporosarcina trichiuri]|uniref:recombinase family protein n=1 Tax=Sporosarcina trichiuri TaxID=3056445 RepID=UPI0025B2E618|nr:recombinase family protein [Sporosarcina sp. 0.2-SM1T-5]WJY27416.1 recombinase family protein [Sporosarcina sp. 0.2-SM1T-5]
MLGDQSLRAGLYVRVSTQEQAREGYSIGVQEERLRAYAASRGHTVVKLYSDPGFSGGNLNRPGLQTMLRDIDQQLVDVILVYKLDRLSRSQKDTLYLIEEVFLKKGVDFVSLSESFDTSTPFGRAMIGILSVFAQLEREQIRERSMMGKEARAKEGYWHGGGGDQREITGYNYIDGELHINPYEAECVRFIFEKFLLGRSIHGILKDTEARFPGVVRSQTTVRKILQNPVYLGKIRYNGEIYEGRHSALIDTSQFDAAEDLLRKRPATPDAFAKRFLLTGLVYCGHCGARLHGRSGGKLKNGDSMRYYTCYSRSKTNSRMVKDPLCTKSSERKEPLEELVIRRVKALTPDDIRHSRVKISESPHLIKALQKEKAAAERQLAKLLELYSLDSIPIDVMKTKMDELTTKREALQEQLDNLAKEKKPVNPDMLESLIYRLEDFDWTSENLHDQQMLLAKLIDRIVVSDDSIEFFWAF